MIKIYSSGHCPYCERAKDFFRQRGLSFEEIMREDCPDEFRAIMEKYQVRTVPQIFINNHHVGGYDDLSSLSASALEKLLQ